jgi:hypothetical protein
MTRNQRIKHWKTLITAIVTDYKALDAACDAAIDAGCMDVNGPLFKAIWEAFERMLDRVDSNGWIAWFIYENQCGERGRIAVVMRNGKAIKTRPIKTPLDLAKIITKEEKQ